MKRNFEHPYIGPGALAEVGAHLSTKYVSSRVSWVRRDFGHLVIGLWSMILAIVYDRSASSYMVIGKNEAKWNKGAEYIYIYIKGY